MNLAFASHRTLHCTDPRMACHNRATTRFMTKPFASRNPTDVHRASARGGAPGRVRGVPPGSVLILVAEASRAKETPALFRRW
ncbi:hypothetical protein GCM10017776_36640 [Streptomyces griseoluteus]|nr:hypothetical protein GCM10017776_36640 [Streptomyces griseoluteus]